MTALAMIKFIGRGLVSILCLPVLQDGLKVLAMKRTVRVPPGPPPTSPTYVPHLRLSCVQ